jgi:ribokinase
MDFILLVEHHPAYSDHVETNEERREPGGHGANQAVACAKLSTLPPGSTLDIDIKVALVGAIGGQDDFGKRICATLTQSGVNVTDVRTIPTSFTGYAHINLDPSGDPKITTVPGANHSLIPSMFVELPYYPKPDLLLLQLEIPLKTVEHLARLAKTAGVPVILNAAPSKHITRDLYLLVDHLIVNEIQADFLTGLGEAPYKDRTAQKYDILQHYLRACDHFHDLGALKVVITLGKLGAIGSIFNPTSGRKEIYIADGAISRHGVRDTTGGSDTFIGAYAVEIVRQARLGLDPNMARAIDWGVKAAGICVGQIGSMPSIPSRVEVERENFKNALEQI